MNKQANLSNLLSATVDELQTHGRMVMIYLAVMVPLAAISLMFEGQGADTLAFNFGFRIDEALLQQGPLAVVAVTAIFVVGLLAHYWLLAGMVRQTSSPGFDRFWPYLGIYILSLFGIVFGILLLIIPGIIIAVRWAPLLPAVIDRQDRAMDAFGDSWEMTSGHSWSIFGAALLLGIGLAVVAGVTTGIGTVLGGQGSVAASILDAAFEQFGTAVFAAFSVGAYRLMRDSSETLAEVFE